VLSLADKRKSFFPLGKSCSLLPDDAAAWRCAT
jgi:hypothetical protein